MKDKLCLSCKIHQLKILGCNCSNYYYSVYYCTNYPLDNENAVMLSFN